MKNKKENKALRDILEEFASAFAAKTADGSWWGHDTDLGTNAVAFGVAIRKINRLRAKRPKQI